MKGFQILNGNVLIINGSTQYDDSVENFKLDSGIKSLPVMIIYDDQQQRPVVKQTADAAEEWPDYPIQEYEDYIEGVQDYIDAKAKREYVPPTFEELQQQALNHQYSLYRNKRDMPVTIDELSFATDDDGQRDWQVAVTLMGDSGQFKVYNTVTKTTGLETVTKDQMLQAGEAARTQQIAAYQDFVAVRQKINNCKTAEDLQPYLPDETA